MRKIVVTVAGVLLLVLAGAGPAGATTAWTIVPPVNPGNGFDSLFAVSCVTQSDCMTVGDYQSDQAGLPLVEHWDGSSWAQQPAAGPANRANFDLRSVSCASADYCLAVGLDTPVGGGALQSWGLRWNGTAWRAVTVPALGNRNAVGTVSCPAVKACIAVGETGKNGLTPIAESWDGTSWTALPAPVNAGQDTILRSVSCTSVSACTAVGGDQTGTVAERWDGSSWTAQSTASIGDGYLTTVSCPDAVTCTAVGMQYTDPNQPLAAQWANGTWTAQPVPHLPRGTSSYNMMDGLSCASANQCTAVALHQLFDFESSMEIYHWNGTRWSRQPAPNDGTLNPEGISCQPGACMAVGVRYSDIGSGPAFAAHN
jgi:hypothetical protein